MALVIASTADPRRAKQQKSQSDRLLSEGEALEKASIALTERIKRINQLYRERLENRVDAS